MRRILWLTQDKLRALQSDVSQRLRGCAEEDKWRFAYRWLFPDTSQDDTPCPCKLIRFHVLPGSLTNTDLQDPVISIVSSVTDDFEIRLRDLIRQSRDLQDLENRIPSIRGQFLAQYGVDSFESSHASSTPIDSRMMSNDNDPETSVAMTLLDTFQTDRTQMILNGVSQDHPVTLSAAAEPTQDHNFTPFSLLQTHVVASEDLDWQQSGDYTISMGGTLDFAMLHDMENDMESRLGSKIDASESVAQNDHFADFVLW